MGGGNSVLLYVGQFSFVRRVYYTGTQFFGYKWDFREIFHSYKARKTFQKFVDILIVRFYLLRYSLEFFLQT